MKTGMLLILAAVSFTYSGNAQTSKNRDELIQVSTIDALISGIYEGEVGIGQLLNHGNFGLGTFNYLDGEMVVLDGKCYQIKSDGSAGVVSSLYTPFASVTFFETDKKLSINDTLALEELYGKIDSLIPSLNYFYAIKISADIISAKARSVPMQKPPYRQLTEITKVQPVFSFQKTKGTLIGFRCPPYINR